MPVTFIVSETAKYERSTENVSKIVLEVSREGDLAAFQKVVEEHKRRMYSLVVKILDK